MSRNTRENDALVRQLTELDKLLSIGLEESSQIYKVLDQAFDKRQTTSMDNPCWALGREHIVIGFGQGRTTLLQKLLFMQADAICLEEGVICSVVPEIFAQRDKRLRPYASPISFRLDTGGQTCPLFCK